MIINKEIMQKETYVFLETLFALSEIKKIAIKNTIIHSIDDCKHIQKGLEQCYHDILSDVDFTLWVHLNPIDFEKEAPIYRLFFSRLGLALNSLFGVTFVGRNINDANKEGLRICLNSGFRMDLTCFITCDPSAQPLISFQPEPFIKQDLSTSFINTEDYNRFWFIAIQALAKLLRHDYLIADHLAHMLLMDTLVIQMLERDAKYQTNFHRYGYSETLCYETQDLSPYKHFLTGPDATYNHIAQHLCKSVLTYNKLASNFSSSYTSHLTTFFNIWSYYLNQLHLNL